MGRHRRSAPQAPEPIGTPPVEAPAVATPAARATATHHHGHRAARGRRMAPVRTGLLGASAAVAMGAVAVASGLVPGSSQFDAGGGSGERVRADSLPDAEPRGSLSVTPTDRATEAASRSSDRPTAPGAGKGRDSSPGTSSASPSPDKPSKSSTAKTGSPQAPEKTDRPATAAPKRSATPSKAPDTQSSAESQVLSLVNQERAQAGCSPVTADQELGSLAQRFSDDMARRDFFDHTDPDGRSPWDRARAQGISNLGGENIAKGQANAQSVMDSWMKSPGHRANILNCEYKTLGVGVHFGAGGPWWTQDFGF
ncbi:CAP domain-containing protein [Streptomyces sp. NPDC091266]|uniref:CAP domain-containing protein n=1 Tax=Streptomyces sp. NPDC091266 TaxID=3365978 RepID=UPI00381F6B66